MIFSRIGHSFSRSSRAGNILYANGRLGTLTGVSRTKAPSVEGVLEFLRGYVSYARSRSNGLLSKLPEFRSVGAKPSLHRLFSSKAPKKRNYEKFLPKNKKEIPKGNDKKSDSKEDSNTNTDDQGSFQETYMKQIQRLITPLLVMGLFLSFFPFGPAKQQQISFQEFKNKLLEPGLVDHIVVSNKSVAKVYVRNTPPDQTSSEINHGTPLQKDLGANINIISILEVLSLLRRS